MSAERSSPMSAERSSQRRRARFALEEVLAWKDGVAKDAATRAQGLPIELRAQGLSTAVAVLMREGRQGRQPSLALARLLSKWLLREADPRPLADGAEGDADRGSGDPTPRALLEASIRAPRTSYLAAQAEALALLDHVKLLARAIHGK